MKYLLFLHVVLETGFKTINSYTFYYNNFTNSSWFSGNITVPVNSPVAFSPLEPDLLAYLKQNPPGKAILLYFRLHGQLPPELQSELIHIILQKEFGDAIDLYGPARALEEFK